MLTSSRTHIPNLFLCIYACVLPIFMCSSTTEETVRRLNASESNEMDGLRSVTETGSICFTALHFCFLFSEVGAIEGV